MVMEVEESLKERDVTNVGESITPLLEKGITVDVSISYATKPNGNARQDKRQIEQRIEEDRERHKRLRESIWAVCADGSNEFERLWADGSIVGEDDYLAADEDSSQRRIETEIT